ncbi:uncharacterized protein LOC119727176 [Patiria miniata]|uniref:Uncharacterized protein n=1 Tax=Patiria miniata TaxID=46514 RepID=A0A913ZV67_PATMI|nr:uncharacterized protein LOC119727176 [Patiria miniata]
MGSRSEKKQPGALVGEKSQTVFSANWKLDAMLLKNLQMLDVSKHRVGHRISMDQRVVNKRFQTKLYRSKITHARMTNNRDLLRELIHRDNYTFNTSVGGQDDQYTVTISPTQKSPVDQEESTAHETLKYGKGKGVRPAATSIVVVEPNADGTHGTAAVREADTTSVPGNKRPSSSASLARKTVTRRSSPVADMPHKQDSQLTLQESTGPKSEQTQSDDQIADSQRGNKTRQRVILDDRRKLRPNTAYPSSSKATRVAQTIRPKTALARQDSRLRAASSQDVQTSSSSSSLTPAAAKRPTTATQRPTSATPRRRTPSSRQQKHTMPSIFGEDKRPTLLDINQDRLARANFPDRVKHFSTSLQGLQTDPDQTVDYYTHRLLENLRGGRGPRQFIESDAEKRDAQRSIGNLNAVNMTFGNIKKIESGDNRVRRSDDSPVKARLRAWGSDDDDSDNLDDDDNS